MVSSQPNARWSFCSSLLPSHWFKSFLVPLPSLYSVPCPLSPSLELVPLLTLASNFCSQQNNSLQVRSSHPCVHCTLVTRRFLTIKAQTCVLFYRALYKCGLLDLFDFTLPLHLFYSSHTGNCCFVNTLPWHLLLLGMLLSRSTCLDSLKFHKFCLHANETYSPFYIKL